MMSGTSLVLLHSTAVCRECVLQHCFDRFKGFLFAALSNRRRARCPAVSANVRCSLLLLW
jgi:hypothetical protein